MLLILVYDQSLFWYIQYLIERLNQLTAPLRFELESGWTNLNTPWAGGGYDVWDASCKIAMFNKIRF